MEPIPTILLFLGTLLIVIALLWHVGGRYFPWGRLPGDFIVEKGNFRFYAPLATSLVLSLLLTLGWWLWQFFRK